MIKERMGKEQEQQLIYETAFNERFQDGLGEVSNLYN
jgi:hypothetical protein